MDFENALFISYAHIDNRPLTDDQEGWVENFHRVLEIRLTQLQGEKTQIWRDPKLQGNDYFSDTILEQFPKVALLVSVLSPRYVKSEWCLRELQHFYQAAEQTGGVRVGDKARIFKVIKTYLPAEKYPPELEPLLGYEFYEFDRTGRPREFGKIFGPESERKYWARLEDLAYDIHQLLESLEAMPGPAAVASDPALTTPSTGKTIYLAETTFDLENERNKIRRELQLQGHMVLPDQPLPYTANFQQVVQAYLARSTLAIHLISEQPAEPLEQASSVANLQMQLATARIQEQIELAAAQSQSQPDFSRVLWMPPGAEFARETAGEFLQSFQGDPDFLRTSLEDLKTLIQDRLTRPHQDLANRVSANGQVQVYLDCDRRDLEAPDIEPLYDYLEQQFQVLLPDYEAGGGLQDSENMLRQCDAVLIYYGQASGLWLKRRVLALKKTLYARLKPLIAQAIYVAAPANPSKQGLADSGLPVIQGFEAFSPNLLEPFMAQMSQHQGG
ncbi:MAG: TIR domain-containing protein [Cyanothece sp. SIO1E1]|nr:TIR domain-containing protein [Cyanothece sp. SIO1E1]